jgi:hypothetical protein
MAENDDPDERRRTRVELLKKALVSLADGDDALAKFGQAIALATGDDAGKAAGLMVLADSMAPGISGSWKRLIAAVHTFTDDGFAKLLGGDPVLGSAARVIQAVLVAVEKQDQQALHDWELKTLAYMMDHAPDDYAVLPIPPRSGRDRHIVLGALVRHIETLLKALPPMIGIFEMTAFSMAVATLVRGAFPHLQSSGDIAETVQSRLPQHVEKAGNAKNVDAEIVLVDALEALGVPRKTVQQSWLKVVK